MAGTYNSNIPSSNRLADPSVAPYDAVAPAIAAGAQRNVQDVTNARLETERRKHLKKIGDNEVTDTELSESAIREFAIAAENAEGAYGAVAAPAWAAPLLAQVAAIQARLDLNLVQRRNNRHAQSGGSFALVPLVKVRPGVGPPTPGQSASNQGVAAVGTVYPNGLSPATNDDLNSLSLDQISQLSEWANDSFGIVAADSVAVRRRKLLDWYTLG